MKAVSFGTVEEAAAAFAVGRPAFRCAVCGRMHRPDQDGAYKAARCLELMLSRGCAAPDGLLTGPRVLRTPQRVADCCASPTLPFWVGREGDRVWEILRSTSDAGFLGFREQKWFELPADPHAFLALQKPVFRAVTAGWRDRLVDPDRRQRIVELASALPGNFPAVPGPVGTFCRAVPGGAEVTFPGGRREFRPGWSLCASDLFLGRVPRVGSYGRKRVAWVWRGERALVALVGDALVFSWGPATLATMLFLEPEEVAAVAGPPSDARFWEEVLP
jgi:hypothetical protein